jgi:hypothetical protein
MHGPETPSISEADVVGRLRRPTVGTIPNWMEITAVFFHNVNPRVRLSDDHRLITQNHHVDRVAALPLHRCELLQVLDQVAKPQFFFAPRR